MGPLPLREMEIGGYWTDGPYRMKSAHPGRSDLFTTVVGKSGRRWVLPDHGLSHGIAVDGGPGSNGCGGATLTYNIVGGGTVELQGPWYSNPDALLEDTGIDLRAKTMTWGCIGRHRDYMPGSYDSRLVVCDLLWWDPVDEEGNGISQIGTFDRVTDLATQMARDRDELVFVFSGSDGGSSCGSASPIPYRHSDFRNHRHAEQPYWDKYNAEFVVEGSYNLPAVPLNHVDLWLEGIEYTAKDIDIQKIRDDLGLSPEPYEREDEDEGDYY